MGAGLAAVAFQLAISVLYRSTLLPLSAHPKAVFLFSSLAVMVTSALGVGWLLHSFCREASGSGIPQLKAAFWKG